MSKVFTLSRVLRKCGKSGEGTTETQQRQNDNFLITLSIIAAFLLFMLGRYIGDKSGEINIILVVPVLCLLVALVTFVISIIRLIGALYMSSDLPVLTTMPFSSFELAFVRLINASYLHFGISFIGILPFTLGYGIFSGASFKFYFGMIMSAILIPIFTTCLSAVLIMFFFTVFKWARNKDLISIVGVMLSLTLTCTFMYFQNKGMNSTNDVTTVLQQVLDTFIRYTKLVPPVYFLSEYIINGTIMNLFIAVLITAAAFLLFYLFAKLFYLKGALAMQTTLSNNKVLSEKDLEKACKKQSQVRSYMKKELRMLRRNPAYLMNCFIVTFVWPLFFLITMAFGGDGLLKISAAPEVFDQSSLLIGLGAVVFITSFITALNFIGVCSISREGKSFYYMKIMPITYHNQIKAKRNTALLICNLGTTLYLFIGFVVFAILGKVAFWTPIFVAIASFLVVYIVVDIQIMWSTYKVNLDWDNETQSMQSMFPVVQMLAGWVVGVILFAFTMVLEIVSLLTAFVPALLLIGILVLSAVLIDKWMYKFTRKKMNYL